MNLNNYLKLLSNSRFQQIITIFFFILFFVIGLNIYKDYGLSNDEPFQRSVGYFWYIHLLENFSNNVEIINEIKQKFQSMYWSNYLNEGNLNQYGILFDTLAAILEELFNINENREAFFLKHFLTFLFFFISSIFFYKIISERYNNNFFSIAFTFIYISSPRIFAESFYNCKDIVFMAFCVYSIYFALKNFKSLTYKNLFLFSLFTAFATNIRIMGIILFLLFFIFLLLDCLENKNLFRKNIFRILFLLFSFPIFVYLFWPFLWNAPIDNFLFTIKSSANFKSFPGQGILYLGSYYDASNLPWHYIPVWILITTPIILILFFSSGLITTSTFLFQKILNLSEKNKLWNTSNEKKDFFMLLFFLIPIFLVILLNSTLYGGWRHLYFIYPCLVYLSAIGFDYVLRNNTLNKFKNIFYILIFFLLLNNIYNCVRFHPFQNVYFNYLFEKKANNLFEIDFWGLGNIKALEYLAKEKYKGEKIQIKVSSYTPLKYSKLILDKNLREIFSDMNTSNENQKFVFTNYTFESNPKFEKKYFIPENYDKIYSLKRGGIIINELFEKN